MTIAYGVLALRGGGQILSFSIDLRCRPYNVRVCDLLTSVDAA